MYEVWVRQYGPLLLNQDAVVSSLAEARMEVERAFVHPVLDDKSLNGKVFKRADFLAFQQASMERRSGYARPETNVAISAPKPIG